jgi:phosphotriesterase-related protein
MSSLPQAKEAFVRTVRGDIIAREVGLAHCHEHTFILPGPTTRLCPDAVLDDLDKTTAELADFYAVDGRTVVDAQAIGEERAPRLQRLASERSGVNIVAATGFQRAVCYPPEHFRFHQSPDQLAQRMIDEIQVGMAIYRGAEVVDQTDVRAGVLKFATDYYRIDDEARKVAEAVAAAHLATGAPILTHTEHGTCALEQIELFERLGVVPSVLLISHLDRNLDLYLHEDVAAAGAYLVYDGISRLEFHSDFQVIQLIRRLLENGYGRQILLGMNMSVRTMWRRYGGGPGITYLANVFLVKLRRAGFTHEMIDMLTTRNPAAALAFRKPARGTEEPPSGS